MRLAVVFDSAGTLLRTYRVAKDVIHGKIYLDIETTTLTASSPERALLVLHVSSREIIEQPSDVLLSAYLTGRKIGFGVACARSVFTPDQVSEILYRDTRATLGDLQECIREVWRHCKREALLVMDSGVILHFRAKAIEFTVTSGGRPFHGALETITALHRRGIATYIASGDRVAKLEKIADHLGIPLDRVHGVATPSIKAQIVLDLKEEYDAVAMVGDGINDLAALQRADVAILSLQQPGEKPAALYAEADHVVERVTDVVPILERIARR
jgi:Cu+-exporting ATPase